MTMTLRELKELNAVAFAEYLLEGGHEKDYTYYFNFELEGKDCRYEEDLTPIDIAERLLGLEILKRKDLAWISKSFPEDDREMAFFLEAFYTPEGFIKFIEGYYEKYKLMIFAADLIENREMITRSLENDIQARN